MDSWRARNTAAAASAALDAQFPWLRGAEKRPSWNQRPLRGANRAAAFIFAVEWLGLLLSAHHVEAADEVRVLVSAAVNALAQAAVIWALYLALEPYVRRRWPQSMISWSRVLSGGFRDPLV